MNLTCVNCGHVGLPNDSWCCSACRCSLIHGLEQSQCSNCGKQTLHRRYRYELMSLCDCHLTDSQRKAAYRAQEIASRKEREAFLASQERENQRKAAAKCFQDYNFQCNVPKSSLPFTCCHLCPRFKNQQKSHNSEKKSGLERINQRIKPIETEETEVA